MRSRSSTDARIRSPRRPRLWAWHQRLGVFFAVVFLIVAATGIALNHAAGLSLDRIEIRANWLYRWYGMNPEGEPVAFQDEGWAAAWGGSLYWDERRIGPVNSLLGAARLGDRIALLAEDSAWLLDSDGALVERLGSESLPQGNPRRIGKRADGGAFVIETATGLHAADRDLVTWTPLADESNVVWPSQASVPDELREALLRQHRGTGLTLYRVMLDLHAGRMFGSAGVFIVDASAAALAFLTLSGVWYAWRAKRR